MMQFRIYADDQLVYDPYLVRNGHNVLSPKLTIELNKAGSLSFVLPPDNKCYDSIIKIKSIIRVYQGEKMVFKGRVMNDERDFYNRKQVYCEGALSFLLDSQMRPYDITCDVDNFLNLVLDNHNAYVDLEKQIEMGECTVLGIGEDLNHTNIDYTNSMECINKELVEKYGGYLRIREVEELDPEPMTVTYLDYLSAYDTVSDQVIEFGKNLMDLTEHISAEDVFTVLIPLGEKQKDSEGEVVGRLTIEEVNDGLDYLENSTGIALFGRIEKTQVWDDITTAEGLLANAEAVLESGANTSTKITMKAVDLSMVDVNVDAFELGELVRVVSAPHNLDTQFQIIKIEYDITNPDQTTYEFSADYGALPVAYDSPESQEELSINPGVRRMATRDLLRDEPQPTHGFFALTKNSSKSTSISQQTADNRRKTADVSGDVVKNYNSSVEHFAEVLAAGFGGHALVTSDAIYIMDEPTMEEATRFWVWNLNGLGYWSGTAGQGLSGSPEVAITMNGEIKADFITTGTLDADIIQAETITADKLEDATGTDWITKINKMLSYATSDGNSMKIGDAKAYSSYWEVTFSTPGATGSFPSGWIRFFPVPRPSTDPNTHGQAGVFCKLHDNSTNNSTVIYLDSNSSTVKYDTYTEPSS